MLSKSLKTAPEIWVTGDYGPTGSVGVTPGDPTKGANSKPREYRHRQSLLLSALSFLNDDLRIIVIPLSQGLNEIVDGNMIFRLNANSLDMGWMPIR